MPKGEPNMNSAVSVSIATEPSANLSSPMLMVRGVEKSVSKWNTCFAAL